MINQKPKSDSVETILSYASNIDTMFSGDVNPQTGLYCFQISLLDVITDHQQGPALKLSLTLNQLTSIDMGFGRGVEINSTYLDTSYELLVLSSGESIKVSLHSVGIDGEVPVVDARINDFILIKHTDYEYKIHYKNGNIETLRKLNEDDAIAWSHYIDNASKTGGVTFDYDPITGWLNCIRDKSGTVYFERSTDGRYRHSFNLLASRLAMHIDDSASNTISFSKPDSPISSLMWVSVNYTVGILPTLISSVDYFYGRIDRLTYRNTLFKMPQNTIGVPGISVIATMQTIDKNNENNLLRSVNYDYGEEDDNNYLGCNGKQFDDTPWQIYSDYLCNVVGNYFYSVTVIEFILGSGSDRVTTYTYDKYHNIIKHAWQCGRCQQSITTEYCLAKGGYNIPFENQDKRCKLPKNKTIVYQDETGSRTETTKFEFDDYGNLLLELDCQTGMRTKSAYYNTTQGAVDGCPEYPFVHYIKQDMMGDPSQRSTKTTAYTYQLLAGSTNAIVPLTQSFVESGQINNYTFNPDGTIAQLHTTLNGHIASVIYAYDYTTPQRITEIITDSRSAMGGDALVQEMVLDALTGTVISNIKQGCTINRVFFPDGRVHTETVGEGCEFEATKTYEYYDLAHEYMVTDAMGNQLTSTYDALSRLCTRRVSVPEWAMVDHIVETRSYNSLGQLTDIAQYDAIADDDPTQGDQPSMVWKSTITYDGWGSSITTYPDGYQEAQYQNPVSQYSYQRVIGLPYETIHVSLDKRTKTVCNHSPDGTPRAQEIQILDVFERTRIVSDKYGARYDIGYDDFDRIVHVSRKDITHNTRYTYSPYSADELVCRIMVNNKCMGEQTFDPFGRLTATSSGESTTQYHYQTGNLYSDQRTLPNNQIQPLSYNNAIQAYQSIGEQDYQYEPASGLCSQANKGNAFTRFTYRFDGLINNEVDAASHTSTYFYTLLGRLTAVVSSTGIMHKILYDSVGNLHMEQVLTSDGILSESTYTYDACRRPTFITTTGNHKTCTKTLDWASYPDQFSCDTTISGGEPLTESLRFLGNGLLEYRSCILGDQSLEETFTYDSDARLSHWHVSGVMAPVDSQGRKLSDQQYQYDDLNNLFMMTSIFSNAISEIRTLHYSDAAAPYKLTQIDIQGQSWFVPQYDIFGNMLNDEQDSVYQYDQDGLLQSVTPNKEATTHYQYDALGRLTHITPPDDTALTRHYAGTSLLLEQQGEYLRHYQHQIGGSIVGKTVLYGNALHQQVWYQNNFQGSPLRATHTDGTTINYAYTAYGTQYIG